MSFPLLPVDGQNAIVNSILYNYSTSTQAWTRSVLPVVFTSTTELIVRGITQSTSTTTGALVVVGGVGIGKNLNVGGQITAQGPIFAQGWQVSTSTGASGNYATPLVAGVVFANTTGTNQNVSLGFRSLENSNSGYDNIAVGYFALKNNIEGSGNIAVGRNALLNNLLNDNLAIGACSLLNNSIGQANLAIGNQTLVNHAIGSNNLAIGLCAINTLTNGNSNIALGVYALQLANTSSYSIAIGESSLGNTVNASENIAIGYNAMICNIEGIQNTAIGHQTLYCNTGGNYNTALGYKTLYNLVGCTCNSDCYGTYGYGWNNIAIGHCALFGDATTGNCANGNIAIGICALAATTYGDCNVAIGYQSMISNTYGYHNVAIGSCTLYANTAGCYNVAMGEYSLQSNTYGSYNTGIGWDTLSYNTTGCYNTAIGADALYRNTYGSFNVAMGWTTLYCNTAGNYNVAMGYSALYGNTTGNNNVAIGSSAGKYGNNYGSIAIGASAGYSCQSNQTVAIGYSAGSYNQSCGATAIGWYAGEYCQGACALALGKSAGTYGQCAGATAVGPGAGYISQQYGTVAVGNQAGSTNQCGCSVAIGLRAGCKYQGSNSVAIGNEAAGGGVSVYADYAGSTGTNTLILSSNAGINVGMKILSGALTLYGQRVTRVDVNGTDIDISDPLDGTPVLGDTGFEFTSPQRDNSVAIGHLAGTIGQGYGAVALGYGSGNCRQSANGVAIGPFAGCGHQGYGAVALGYGSAFTCQGQSSIAIGIKAGCHNQGAASLAIGELTGWCCQGTCSVAIGSQAGAYWQGNYAVSVGAYTAVNNQGECSIAIGAYAGQGFQTTGSIIINATGAELNSYTTGTYIAPVRGDTTNTQYAVFYNAATKEITTATSVSAFNGGVVANTTTFLSTVTITSSTQSISTTTGALVVTGGVGIGRDVWIGGDLYVNNINVLQYDPNVYFVSSSVGLDTNDGRRISSAFRTIKKALSVATTGTSVFVESGTYTEQFPLTIPAGTTVKGAGIRVTIVQPTTATNTSTAFYLNGETNVCDLSLTGFYQPGYGFEFAPGTKISTRSPYIERVTVITRGSVTSTLDPYGFNQADAGNGARLDASVLDSASLEPAMLWNEVTFIVPNATGIYMTNGARAELLNGFFYFADKAINAVSGNAGYGSTGTTKLKLSGTTGTFTTGDKLVYKSTTGTVITSGTIASVVGSYIYLNGPVWGFETPTDRTPKTITAYGSAQLSTAHKKFGTSSLLLNGTTDFALVPTTADFLFANSNLTIELWVYRAGGTGVNQVLLDFRTASTQVALALYLSTTYVPTLQVNGSAVIVGGAAVSLNTWTHIAVSKSGTSTKLFVNGTQSGSTYTDNNSYIQGPLSIGANYAQASWFNGYIDDLRVSNVARYTTTFTAPTSELTNDVSTLLMLHFNGSNGSTSISDDYLVLQDISSVGASPATATRFTLADYHQFGAELRCIGSAAVFGNSGVTANGTGTDLKLIAFNMSHIGSGKDLSDDTSLTVQANEVIQLNNGKIYYQTVDQSGDFRVGNSFLINQRTGNVSFGSAQVNLSSLNQLIISDGVNNASIFPTSISVGDLVFSGDSIVTQGGNLTINAGGSVVTIDDNTQVNGGLTVSGITTVTNATSAVSTATGALIIAGGAGVGKDLYVGGLIYTQGWAVSTGTTSTYASIAYALANTSTTHVGTAQFAVTATNITNTGSIHVGTAQFAVTATNATNITNTGSIHVGTAQFAVTATNLSNTGSIHVGTAQFAVTATNLSNTGTIHVRTAQFAVTATNLTNTATTHVGTAQFAVTASNVTNIASGLAGYIPIQSAAGQTSFIATGTVGYVLQMQTNNTATWVSTSSFGISAGITFTGGTVANPTTFSSTVTITSSTQSVSTTTGALIVTGGVGIGGNTYIGGDINAPNGQLSVNGRETTDGSIRSQVQISSTGTYTSAPVAGIEFSTQYAPGAGAGLGGISVGKLNTTSGDYSSYLSLHTRNNGSGVTERLRIDNTGSTIIYSTNTSISTSTGALVVAGGVGVGGNTYIGGGLYVGYPSSPANALIIDGDGIYHNGSSIRISGGGGIGTQPSISGTSGLVAGNNGPLDLYGGGTSGNINLRTGATFGTVIISSSATISTQTGALQVLNGGAGIGGSLFVGNTATILSTASSISTTTGALVVAGGVGVGGNLYSGGNIKLISLGGAGSFSIDAVGYSNALSITHNGSDSYINFAGTNGDLYLSSSNNKTVRINSTTSNTSTTTGALVVAGGVGIGGSIYVGNTASFISTASSISTTTGALIVAGGVGVAGNLYVGNKNAGNILNIGGGNGIDIGDTTNYISSRGSNLTIGGGGTSPSISATPGIIARNNSSLDLYGGSNNIYLRTANNSATIVTSTFTSISTSTGALQVAGGVGIAGDVYVGGGIFTKGWAVSTATSQVASSTTATNIAGGLAGYIPIQSAAGLTSFISTGSVGYVLQMQTNNTATWVSTGTLGMSGGSAPTISNDVSTNATYFPAFTTTSTGGLTSIIVSTSKLTWNPSTGIMSVVDINTTSDERLKTNINSIADPLSILDRIQGKSFNYLDSGVDSFGVIAQQIESVLPQLVSNDEEGYKTVRYLPLIAILIEGVKQLSAEIQILKNNK